MASLPSEQEEDNPAPGRPVFFPSGLPGFPHLRRFRLMVHPTYTPPFELLASEEDAAIGFYLIDPILIEPNYTPKISPADQKEVAARRNDKLCLRAIVTVGEDARNTTANLAAPLVLNLGEGLGCQAILDGTSYSMRASLFTGS